MPQLPWHSFSFGITHKSPAGIRGMKKGCHIYPNQIPQKGQPNGILDYREIWQVVYTPEKDWGQCRRT